MPALVARAVVVPWSKMVARCVQRIAVILVVGAHLDRVLAELAVISLSLAGTEVENLDAVALPGTDLLVAGGVVQARLAGALVHVDVTVPAHVRAGAFCHDALFCVLLDE